MLPLADDFEATVEGSITRFHVAAATKAMMRAFMKSKLRIALSCDLFHEIV